MANQQIPYTVTLLSAATVTSATVVNGTAVDFPTDLDCGTFYLAVTAPTGTTETLDVEIQVSPDNGTTYFKRWKFTQVTTAAISYAIDVAFARVTEAGAITTVTPLAATALAGAALNVNCACPRKVRVSYCCGGTSPSYATVKVFFVGHRNAPSY